MSKKSRSLVIFVLAVALLAAGDGLAQQQQQTKPELTEEFHQSYPLTAEGRVSLSNLNGRVRVGVWDRNEVKVDAVKKAYKAERLREAEIKIDAAAEHLHIETEYPRHEQRSKENWTREDNPATVEYTLTVPRRARLDEIELVNGALDIEGVGGAVNASSVNGRVTAKNLTGPVRLSVVNGRLEASFDRLNESSGVSLSSVNGPLSLTIPSDSNALLKADTVHGSIANDFNLPVRVGEYVGKDLEGRLGAGAARVKLSNVNGAIQIRRANDNRPLSPATNLLSETTRVESHDDDDADVDDEDLEEAREEARASAREAREAAREAARDVREARAEAASERAAETREARQEQLEAEREDVREARDASREAAKIAREAEREIRKAEKEIRKAVSENGVVVREDAQRRIERESNTVAVQGASRVRVETFDGQVNVHAWDKPEVMYTAIKRAGDDREMKGIKVQSSSGAEVVIRAEFDKSFAHDYVERGGRVVSFNSGASVEFDVYVPRNSALFVSSGDGRLRVEGVSGELELRTGDGPIDVAESRGRLTAQTGDGRIRLDNFDGEASARTGDGRITLDGRFSKLAARTGDGTISLSVPSDSNATLETDAESVSNDGVAVPEDGADKRVRRWRIGGGGGQLYTLHTGGGQVIIRRR
jgi:DUF4097 and DUF4098 domain-containing protein YvlB